MARPAQRAIFQPGAFRNRIDGKGVLAALNAFRAVEFRGVHHFSLGTSSNSA
jgi:hypothetical protein